MPEKKTVDIFEFYSSAFKSWSDMFRSWTKLVGGFSKTLKTSDMGEWFKPLWGYLDDLSQVNATFMEMMRNRPWPFESMGAMGKAAAEGISLYLNIYETWLRSIDRLARDGYELGSRMMAGEAAETDKFFDSLKDAYDDVTTSFVDSLKETPFAQTREMDQAVKNALDAFPEEQEGAKEFFKELFGYTIGIVNLSTSAMREATRTFTDMLGKGSISPDAYEKIMEMYAETLKQSKEILHLPGALLPNYKDTVDDAINWAEKNLDLFISRLEMNLKAYQQIGTCASEINRFAEEVFKERTISSPEEFRQRWSETFQSTTRNLMESSHFYKSIPKFIKSYTDWIKSTRNLYGNVMTVPDVRKRDLDALSEELQKVKTLVRKGSKTKAKGKKSTKNGA